MEQDQRMGEQKEQIDSIRKTSSDLCISAYYESILESVHDGIWVTDKDDRIEFFNKGMEQIAGVPRDECIGKHVLNEFPKETVEHFKNYYLKAKQTQTPMRYTAKVTTPAGRVTIQNGWLVPKVTDDQQYDGMICSIQDITESKKAEEYLLYEKRRAESYLNQAGTMLLTLDTQGNIKLLNRKGYDILGYDQDELIGRSWFDTCIPQDIASTVKEVFFDLIKGKNELVEFYENPIIRKDGTERLIAWHNTLLKNEDGTIEGILSSGEDITEQKRAEKELYDSKERLQLALQAGQLAIWDWNVQDHHINYNEQWAQIIGYDVDELDASSDSWKHMIHPDDYEAVKKILHKHWNGTSDLFTCDYRVRTKKERYRWIHTVGRVVEWDEDHQPVRMIGTHSDITDRKNVEERIRESEGRYRQIFEDSPEGIMTLDTKGFITGINKAGLDLFGIPKEDILGKHFTRLKILRLKDIPRYARIFSEILQGNIPEQLTVEFMNASENRLRTVDVYLNLLKKERKTIGIQVLSRDITEKKQKDEQLQEVQERYTSLFDSTLDLVYVYDFKANFLDANDAALRLLGYSKAEIPKLNFRHFLDSGQLLKAYHLLKEIKKKGYQENPSEFKLRCRDGSYIYVETNSQVITHNGKPVAIQGIARDITKRIESEAILKKAKNEPETILNAAADGIRVIGTDFKVKAMNQTMADLANVSVEEGTGMYCYDFFRSDNCGTPNCSLVRIKNGEKHFEQETIRYTKEGKDIPCIDSVSAYQDENGSVIGIIEDFRDITEIKRAQEELTNEKLLSESLLNGLPGVFYFIDNNNHIIRWNKNLESLTGYSQEELQKVDAVDLFVKEDTIKVTTAIKEVFMKGSSTLEARFLSKNGEGIPYYLTGLRVDLESKPYILGLGIDLTTLKMAERELTKAHEQLKQMNQELEKKVEERTSKVQSLLKQKDGFINQLGHDLKNPLGPMINLLPLIEKKETDPRYKEMIQVIMRNVGYMKNLVAKTIELAQLNSPNTEFNFEDVSLHEFVENIIQTNTLLFSEKGISVENSVPLDIIISADTLRLEELFNNLLNNAVKYSPKNGKVNIEASSEKGYTTISIRDTGIGMTPEQIDHIFDEFYKADESRHDFDSSGLGMPIALRIVERHKGRIWVESEGTGKGSTFYFTIPLSKTQTSLIDGSVSVEIR